MSQDTKFEQKKDAEVIKDKSVIEKARRGPDVYCVYCGNRNPAGTTKCERCGADLSEGEARKSGQQYTVQSETSGTSASSSPAENAGTSSSTSTQGKTVICTACGTANPIGAMKCSGCGAPLEASTIETTDRPQANPATPQKKGCGKGCLIIAVILAVLAAIVFFGLMGGGTSGGGENNFSNSSSGGDVFDFGSYDSDNGNNSSTDNFSDSSSSRQSSTRTASVSSMRWTTSVQVMGNIDSRDSGWRDELPSDAKNVECQDRLKYTSDEEVAGSREVCGEPYSIDLGNGYEQLTQDCQYEVYEKYCNYTTSTWGLIDTKRTSGSGKNPELPYVDTSRGYEMGDQSVSYEVTLRDENGETYTLNPSSQTEYNSYSIGDEYVIDLNSYGRITGMERK